MSHFTLDEARSGIILCINELQVLTCTIYMYYAFSIHGCDLVCSKYAQNPILKLFHRYTHTHSHFILISTAFVLFPIDEYVLLLLFFKLSIALNECMV